MDQTIEGVVLNSDHTSICVNSLKIDDKLRLGRDNFKDLLSSLSIINDKSCKNEIDNDVFPNAYELAQLSNLIYTEKLAGEADESYADRLNLPSGWKLLTTASNADGLNGYFGAAFVNLVKRHVVVAHRGSKITNFGSIWTDVFGVVFQNYVARMNSAVTFAEHVVTKLCDIPAVGLTFTGHSLGGWLAQITCFSSMHLHKSGSRFVKNNPSQGVHSHTVVFDSPGCRDMLVKLKESYDLRYDSSISLDNLDITTYVSAPNRFNTINVHFGTVYRIFPDFSDMNYLEKNWFLYTLAVHRMFKIARVFDRETGKVSADEDGQLRVKEVTDWPISGALRGGEEYDNFFTWAKPFNNYHPDIKDEQFISKQNISLRYRTKKYDEEICPLRVFAPNELQFLKWWLSMKQWWSSMKNVKVDTLQEFISKYELGDYRNLLPDFSIDRKKIQCNSLSILINRTKQLFRLFSAELMITVKEQFAPLSVIKSMFMVFESEIQHDVNFDDNENIGLREFLGSDTHQVLCITTPDPEFEKIRTFKLCERIQGDLNPDLLSQGENFGNDHRIVVSWQQMLSLEKLVDITSIMETELKYDLIIVTYSSQAKIIEESKVVLDKLFSVPFPQNVEKERRKIIFLTSKNSALNEYISSCMNMKDVVIYKHVNSISFSDLSVKSRFDLLQKSLISLHGTEYTMAELFKIPNENIDSDVLHRVNQIIYSKLLKNIIDPNTKTVQIQHKYMEFHDQEVSYVKLCKNVSKESAVDFLLNANDNLNNFSTHIIFFLSGVPKYEGGKSYTDYTVELFKHLHISGEGKKNQLRDALDTSIFIGTGQGNMELEFKQFCRDPKYCKRAVFWLKINDVDATWQQVYDNNLYITRKFNSQIIIKLDILEKIMDTSCPDNYIFSNCDKRTLIEIFAVPQEQVELMKRKIITKSTEGLANAKFDEKSTSKNNKGAVHLIKFDKKTRNLIWQKSSGSLDSIRNYSLADSFTINEQSFCERDDKVIILSGDPAIGKSITLCSLSRQMKSTWVIHKDLKNYQSIMNISPRFDINDVVRYLMENDNCTSDNLSAVLLKACLTQTNTIPVLVIFDGFDEIKKVSLQNKKFTKNEHQKAQTKILQLLEFLKNCTRAKIWVTTRTLHSRMLENQFSIFATKFEELGKEELKQYLKRFWLARLSIELKEYHEREEQILINYLDKFAEFAESKSIFGKEISSYIGIPLQMRMIAEIAQPQVKMFLNSDDKTAINLETSSQIKNIFDLFERFIEAKYDIFAQSSSSVPKDEKWKKILNKEHRYLSFQLLFPEDAKEFLGEKLARFSKDNWGEEEMELNRVGLIRFNMKGEFDFLHNTFAEFFVAGLFLHWLSKGQGYQKFPEFLISKILLHSDYRVIRIFLNNHLALYTMPQKVLKYYGKRFITAWQKDRTIFFNRKRQTALHVASAENCGHLVALILCILDANKVPLGSPNYLTSTALVAARDQSKKTALYLASKYRCDESMCKFLEYLKKSASRIAQQQILLCTLYRKSRDKDYPDLEYLLLSAEKVGCERINLLCDNIFNNWDSITEFVTNARRDLFRDFLFSGFYTTVDQYLLMIHKPLDVS